MPVHYVYGIIIATLSIMLLVLAVVMFVSMSWWGVVQFLGGFFLMDGILLSEASQGWFVRIIGTMFVGWSDWTVMTLIVTGFVMVVASFVIFLVSSRNDALYPPMAHAKR